MQKKLLFTLILSLVAVGLVVPIHQAMAEEPRRLEVGDVLRVESIRGMAHESGTSDRMRADLVLTLTVTNVNDARGSFTLTSGEIGFGDNTFTVTSGEGHAIVRKFGWIVLRGSATLSSGKVFEFRLEGMLHLERPGLVLAGLAGGIRNENSHYGLRLIAKISRA